MHFPTWIDLKGQDSVPETVHHVVMFSPVLKTLASSWFSTDVVSMLQNCEVDGVLGISHRFSVCLDVDTLYQKSCLWNYS